MKTFSDEELIDLFNRQLPDLLDRRPDLEPLIYQGFLGAFARREEVAVVLTELRALRTEMDQRFEQVDQRFEQADRRFEQFREQVDQRFEQVDQRFEQVDQRFEQVDQRFEQADRRFEQFREEVNQRFEQVDARIDAFREEVNQRFDEVFQALDRLGGRWGIRNESVFRRTMAALLEESFGAAVEERVIEGEQFDVVIVAPDQHILVEIAASVGASIQERLERKRRLYTEATGVAPARVLLATADIYSYRAQALREAGIEVIEPAEAD